MQFLAWNYDNIFSVIAEEKLECLEYIAHIFEGIINSKYRKNVPIKVKVRLGSQKLQHALSICKKEKNNNNVHFLISEMTIVLPKHYLTRYGKIKLVKLWMVWVS